MKAIIIHGTKGSPKGNWYPWLADQLSLLGVHTIVPEMPTPDNQNLESWNEVFADECGPIAKDTILIGHSCGAVHIMRLLEKADSPAACTALVAPPYSTINIPEYDALNSSFLREPFDWDSIISNAGHLIYLMSEKDQYVPQEQLLAIARGLKVDPIVVPGGGHLNAETGFTSFPLLLERIRSFITTRVS